MQLGFDSSHLRATFTFMHLADAFIQSDLHCIQVTVFTFYQLLLSLGKAELQYKLQYKTQLQYKTHPMSCATPSASPDGPSLHTTSHPLQKSCKDNRKSLKEEIWSPIAVFNLSSHSPLQCRGLHGSKNYTDGPVFYLKVGPEPV